MLEQSVNWDCQWGQIVARAWADGNFKQRLFADPAATLREYELTPPADYRIAVFEESDPVPQDADGVLHLVLPGKPSSADLSEEELFSGGGAVGVDRCGCGGCFRCHRCACGWCGGCHHPPKPDED